jgi:Domain of unknown function (DUF1996)/F5/8 type C domain
MKSIPPGGLPRPRRRVLDRVSPRLRVVAGLAAVSLTALAVVVSIGSAQAADTLLSQGKTATASSTENDTYTPASRAVDGSTGSRWSSERSDPQWLQVDLGATSAISKVVLTWETAYAKAFQIQTSADATNWTTIYTTTTGTGGSQTLAVTGSGRYLRMYGTARGTGYGYSLWELQVYGAAGSTSAPTSSTSATTATPSAVASTGSSAGPSAAASATGSSMPSDMPGMPMPTGAADFNPNLDPGESITVTPAAKVIAPDPDFQPPADTYHHEFQANCSVTRSKADDPIVFPGKPGASHMHTFMGSTTTDAASTTGSLSAGATSCVTPADKSGYWFPTMYNGDRIIAPTGPQVIYYKSGIYDYRTVQPFPKGLRFVVGSPTATEDQFKNSPGAVEGWECGDSSKNWDFPANCPAGTQLNVRMQSPSCWDGVHLDSADHKSHMAYPVLKGYRIVCPDDHPVALPMIEFKMAFPVSGDMSQVHLASGRGYSWHYDFFNAWDPTILAPLVKHCINGGLQCNPRGFDLYKPARGGVLDENYQLLPGVS